MKAIYNISLGVAMLLFGVTFLLSGNRCGEQAYIAVISIVCATLIVIFGELLVKFRKHRNRRGN